MQGGCELVVIDAVLWRREPGLGCNESLIKRLVSFRCSATKVQVLAPSAQRGYSTLLLELAFASPFVQHQSQARQPYFWPATPAALPIPSIDQLLRPSLTHPSIAEAQACCSQLVNCRVFSCLPFDRLDGSKGFRDPTPRL